MVGKAASVWCLKITATIEECTNTVPGSCIQ